MSTWVTIRSLNRSQNVRVAGVKLTPNTTARVDIDDPKTRRDFQQHSAIGAITVLPDGTTGQNAVVWSGGVVSPGAALNVNVATGEVRNNLTDTYVTFAATTNTPTLAAAPGAGQSRLDLIQVNYTTGVISAVTGVAAATGSQVAPSAAAGNIGLATVLVGPSQATPIPAGNFTDVRPRY